MPPPESNTRAMLPAATPPVAGPRGAHASRGFGLLEMVIAVALLVGVLAMVFGSFFNTRREIDRIGSLVNSRQSARATIQLVERDIRMSGSGWGKMSINYSNNGTAATWYAVNPGPGSGNNDSLRIVGAWSTATNTTAAVATATTNLVVASVAGLAVNDLILIVDKAGTVGHLFQITAINSSTKTISHATTSSWNVVPSPWNWPVGGYASGALVYKIDILSYSVDATNFRRPALVRRSFGGAPTVVSYDVTNFRVWYRMQDGTLTRTPTVSGTGVALVDKVRPVVFTTLADPRHPTDVDSVWSEVRPRSF